MSTVDGHSILNDDAERNYRANKAIAHRFLEEIWNQRNPDLIEEIMAPDFVGHLPDGSTIAGFEGERQHYNETITAFPDFHIAIEDVVAEDSKVVVCWTGTGTHQGELTSIPPTGVQMTITGILEMHIVDGKIAEIWSIADMAGLLEELGVMPPTRQDYTWGAPSEVTGDPGDPAANTGLTLYVAQKFWNEQNVDALDKTHSFDAIAHNPVIPGQPLPYHIYKQVCLVHLAAFPDFRLTIEDTMAEGDKVAIRWTVTGTHQAELMGIPATGRLVAFTGITIYRLADGRIMENWWAYDALGMMQQITAPPGPGPAQQ